MKVTKKNTNLRNYYFYESNQEEHKLKKLPFCESNQEEHKLKKLPFS